MSVIYCAGTTACKGFRVHVSLLFRPVTLIFSYTCINAFTEMVVHALDECIIPTVVFPFIKEDDFFFFLDLFTCVKYTKLQFVFTIFV